MKNPFLARATVATLGVAIIFGFVVSHTASDAAGAANSRAPILVIDRREIMTDSKLGQDIHRQIMAYEDKIQSDLGAQGQALQNEMQTFQQASATMPPAEREKKAQALQARETDYRQKLQARQSLVQGGELVARQRYLKELAGVVEAVMAERGAYVVVEKSTIVASARGLDITQPVIDRLDQKITSFKVPLVKAPPTGLIQLH